MSKEFNQQESRGTTDRTVLNSCAMQASAEDQSKTYVIPAEAYGQRLRGGWRWLVWFAEYFSMMFASQVLFDLFFEKSAGRPYSPLNWTHDAWFSLFWGAGMTVFAAGKTQGLSGLQIRSDSVVLYEGETLDPLYRIGRVVPASEIRGVREVGNSWFTKRSGLIVKHGSRLQLFATKQFYIPLRTPEYAQIKEQLISMRHQAS